MQEKVALFLFECYAFWKNGIWLCFKYKSNFSWK